MDKPLEMQESTGALSKERVALITKIYGLLAAAVLTAAVGAKIGAAYLSIATAQVGGLVGLLILIAALVFRRVRGLNLALLFGFAALKGLCLGPILGFYVSHGAGPVVTQALFMTFGTFAALTAYVFWSKTDFSYLRGFLFAGLIGLILVGLMSVFTGMSSGFSLVYAYFGVLIFVGYTLYDTSEIIHRVDSEDYVEATLMLFLDIVNLFRFILQIFLSRDE